MADTGFAMHFFSGPQGIALAAAWGAIWGSFFNVVIVRVPEGRSIVRPGSQCGSCQQAVRWYDNIPLLSFLWLRGRCRSCGARFSARYLLVEALLTALAVVLHQLLVVHGSGDLPLRLAQLAISTLFAGVLVAVAFIDLDTMRIPNAITYPGIPVAAALSVFMNNPHLWDGLVGAVAGYLLIRLIADGYELLTRRQGMGYGDAKLLALIGGLLGWQALLPTLFLASLQGSFIGVGALCLARGQRRGAGGPAEADGGEEEGDGEEEREGAVEGDDDGVDDDDDEQVDDPDGPLRYARIPFGPFLSLAALELLLLRQYLPQLFPYLF